MITTKPLRSLPFGVERAVLLDGVRVGTIHRVPSDFHRGKPVGLRWRYISTVNKGSMPGWPGETLAEFLGRLEERLRTLTQGAGTPR